jgi:hypothetical protein
MNSVKELICVYTENHTKFININCRAATVNADGTYSYRSALKG